MSRLIIFGGGGHATVVADLAELSNEWSDIALVDDAFPVKRVVHHWPIIGKIADAGKLLREGDSFFVAIGDSKKRNELISLNSGFGNLAKIIHPSAVVSRYSVINQGVVVMPGAVINAGAIVSTGAIVNTGAIVEHDCLIGEYSHVCPGSSLAGSVKVGCHTWIGIGTSVKQGVTIGSNVLIGAGSVVIRDVPDDWKVAGVPARPI